MHGHTNIKHKYTYSAQTCPGATLSTTSYVDCIGFERGNTGHRPVTDLLNHKTTLKGIQWIIFRGRLLYRRDRVMSPWEKIIISCFRKTLRVCKKMRSAVECRVFFILGDISLLRFIKQMFTFSHNTFLQILCIDFCSARLHNSAVFFRHRQIGILVHKKDLKKKEKSVLTNCRYKIKLLQNFWLLFRKRNISNVKINMFGYRLQEYSSVLKWKRSII